MLLLHYVPKLTISLNPRVNDVMSPYPDISNQSKRLICQEPRYIPTAITLPRSKKLVYFNGVTPVSLHLRNIAMMGFCIKYGMCSFFFYTFMYIYIKERCLDFYLYQLLPWTPDSSSGYTYIGKIMQKYIYSYMWWLASACFPYWLYLVNTLSVDKAQEPRMNTIKIGATDS